MLGTADRQGSLLGVDSLFERLFEGDDDSFYARLAAHGEEVISDEDFAECYAKGKGRPSIPPSLLMKAVLCQIRDDVSDREAARRAAKDLDWKRALGLDAHDIPFHHTTLSVFRSRLLVNDADGIVLRRTLERAVAAGLFKKRVTAIADSTGVMGAAAVQDTYELLRSAIAKVVMAAGGPEAFVQRLYKPTKRVLRGKATIDWADADARREEVGRLVATAKAVLAATEGRDDLAEARDLLSRIVDQDIEDGPGGPGIRHGVARDRVISTVDPEMRHGRKTASQRIDGYKAHVLTDHDSELVLAIEATPANRPDGPEAGALVAQAKAAGVVVKEVLGDTAYGDGDTREAVESQGATVVAKTQPPSPTGKFTKTEFFIDPDVPEATCPAGEMTTDIHWARDHRKRSVPTLVFSADQCGPCPIRADCTVGPRRRVTLNFHEARLQAARAEQLQPRTKRKLRRRAVVERKLADLKRHGMGRARYRGERKVLLQLRLTAGLANIKRIFTMESTRAAA